MINASFMNKVIFLIISAFLTQNLILSAETTITKDLQSFRKSDVLYKQQIEYKDPGRNGQNVVWDFSSLNFINERYQVKYLEPAVIKPDTLCITNIEHRTKYKFFQSNDSLFLAGFENSGTKHNFNNPQLVMHFPLTYTDSIFKEYSGTGIYKDMLYVVTKGVSYSVADATGTLILPEDDTLRHVLRVRTQQEYIQMTYPKEYSPDIQLSYLDSLSIAAIDSARTADTDTIYYRTEICRWYGAGYRYPVFETICNYSHLVNDTVEMKDISTAFYFPPIKHDYLESDPGNVAVIDSLKLVDAAIKVSQDSLFFDYNCYPNPVRSNLKVELLLDLPSNVVFRVYDLAGNLEFTKQEGQFPPGLHLFNLNLIDLNTGPHLLHFVVNEQTAQTLIIKMQ